jgi:hypothetical protein
VKTILAGKFSELVCNLDEVGSSEWEEHKTEDDHCSSINPRGSSISFCLPKVSPCDVSGLCLRCWWCSNSYDYFRAVNSRFPPGHRFTTRRGCYDPIAEPCVHSQRVIFRIYIECIHSRCGQLSRTTTI